MDDIIYISIMFYHKNHRAWLKGYDNKNSYIEYFNSIKKMDKFLTNKNIYIFCDMDIYDELKTYNIENINLIVVDYKESEFYKLYYEKFIDIEKDVHKVKSRFIYHLKIYYMKYILDHFPKIRFNYCTFIDAGCMRDQRYHFFNDWFDNNLIINNIKDININWCIRDYNILKNIEKKSTDRLFINLIQSGHHEMAAGAFCFHKKIIPYIYDEYIKELNFIVNELHIISSEQRIFTLILIKMLNNGNTNINIKNHKSGNYHVPFHL